MLIVAFSSLLCDKILALVGIEHGPCDYRPNMLLPTLDMCCLGDL